MLIAIAIASRLMSFLFTILFDFFACKDSSLLVFSQINLQYFAFSIWCLHLPNIIIGYIGYAYCKKCIKGLAIIDKSTTFAENFYKTRLRFILT